MKPAHPPELRQQALDLLAAGASQGRVAKDLGLPRPTIGGWARAARRAAGSVAQEPHQASLEITAILEDGTAIVGAPEGLAAVLRALGLGR